MAREFSDAAGERWTASESGFYFDDDFPQDEVLSEGAVADVEFRSERGRRTTGYMTRGGVDDATEDELRTKLAEALWQNREVQ